MNYSDVYIEAIGYELAPNVVHTSDLETRLSTVYKKLHLQPGQLEALTGIRERRYWDPGFKMSTGAIAAGKKALARTAVSPESIGMLIYAGVCRDNLEPATACAVANALNIGSDALIYDVSNACLGVVNGMIQIANAIETGQISAGMVVSCESARQIVDTTIERLLTEADMEMFKMTIATLTGGSGAVAVLLTSKGLAAQSHRLIGGIARNATIHHKLCTWGPDTGIPASAPLIMETDSVGVLQHGVALGIETYRDFREKLGLAEPGKIICHQVGSAHQKTVLKALGIPVEKDFTTYQYLGNIGTVSLPLTAAIANERGFLESGDLVGLFGIGSGLNCLLMAVEW
ncbi:MAG: 3-oxoacyl-ACP synthase III [Desulfobacterales bacterium]|nr:3-oxoacyl-ACP synthase III [Desulfobacterales bacterium]